MVMIATVKDLFSGWMELNKACNLSYFGESLIASTIFVSKSAIISLSQKKKCLVNVNVPFSLLKKLSIFHIQYKFDTHTALRWNVIRSGHVKECFLMPWKVVGCCHLKGLWFVEKWTFFFPVPYPWHAWQRMQPSLECASRVTQVAFVGVKWIHCNEWHWGEFDSFWFFKLELDFFLFQANLNK